MHICFVTTGTFSKNPALKRATGMAKPLMRLGHKVSLLLVDSDENRLKAHTECPGANLVLFNNKDWTRNTERKKKNEILKNINPDLVWICSVNIRNWVRKPNRSCVTVAEHTELQSVIPNHSFLRKLYYTFVEYLHIWNFDVQIVASRYLEKYYLRLARLVPRKSHVFYSPFAFDPELHNVSTPVHLTSRPEFTDRTVVMYMGSMWKNYGFWDMMQAAELAYKTNPNLLFVFIGRGPEFLKAVDWVKIHKFQNFIHLLGYIPDRELDSYFQSAHSFLCPLCDTKQDWARCPSKLFMYLPYSKPIVTCAIGEAKELFGENYIYYTTGDIHSFSRCILQSVDFHNKDLNTLSTRNSWKMRSIDFLNYIKNL